MAITMMNLKALAGRMTGSGKSKGGEQTLLIMQNLRKMANKEPERIPLLGYLPTDKQYLYAGGALIGSLLLAAGFTIAMLQIAAIDLLRFWLTGTWGGFSLG